MQTWLTRVQKNISDTGLVVLGNEAADLDSMASSITYGYLRSLLNPQISVLPVMPIPRADFILRTEAVYVFAEANVNLQDVVFIDEVDFDKLMEKAGLVLVDHNQIAAGLEKFSSQVVSILDHHKDEGLYTSATPRMIEPVGSTTTLVAREFMSAGIAISRDAAVLITGTILLDTVNLDDAAGRVTDADKEIAAQLLPLCPLPQQLFFERVHKEKFNVAGLSTDDLLRKDYKEWQFGRIKCGIASALLPVGDWAAKDNDLAAGFAAFMAKRNLDLLLSMNAYTNPDFHRDLVVFCTSRNALHQLFNFLQENGLELTPLNCSEQQQPDSGFIGFYRQGNLAVSRKKIQPLLAELYK